MFHRQLRECLDKLGPNTFFWKNEPRWDDSCIFSNKLNLFYIPSKVFDKVLIQKFKNTNFIIVVFCEWRASFE